ncbi:hypothetical protein SAMN02910453_0178 [Lachnospiraceae bacterium A10]|jgi:regulator of extracellular matrix RemA (YlzA/DUF370 family)|nr:hypothetical protein SAMN02910453_0178 [Lachnospiraceae bacterium A10]
MFINIGFGNMVNSTKILAMISSDSAPAKRMIQKAKEEEQLIDATQGRRTRTVLVMENGQVVLSALVPETIALRTKEGITVEKE